MDSASDSAADLPAGQHVDSASENHPDIRSTLRTAWHRVLHLWRPMAIWTLLVWACVAIVLTPLSSWVVGRPFFRGPDGLIGNEQILAWLFTPVGIAFILFGGALALIGAVVRYAGLYHMVVDDLEGRSVGVRRTALRLLPKLPALYRLCVVTVAGAALLALPLAAGLFAVWQRFLAAHDINYYLALRPPEWHHALAWGGAWTLVWLCTAGWIGARSVIALPATLDGHRPLPTAIRRSWTLTRGRGKRLIYTLVGSVALWLLLRALGGSALVIGTSLLVEGMASVLPSLRLLAFAAAAGAAASLAFDAAAGFLGFAFLATVLTKFYYVDSELHAEAPPPPRLTALPGALRRRAHALLRPVRLVPVLAFLLMGSVVVGGFVLERIGEPVPAIVHAHRTGPPPSPENTLAALERSIDAGADFAEIDVQRTRDGVVVIAHDADLMRVAGDPRRFADADFADLAEVVQRPDDGTPEEERRLATLDEFLERARGRIGLNIELKYYGWDPGLAAEVVRLVREHEMDDEVVLMSLDLRAVQQVREIAPELPVGYVATVTLGDPTALDVDFLAVPVPQFSPALLRRARARGVEVLVWTVNDRRTMIDLVRRGVDGIITDDPALAVAVNRELAGMPVAALILLGVGR